jgi:hypothetical protein
MLRRLTAAPGFRSTRSLRSHASLHPHFCKPWKPTVSFIGLAKTSYTPGTLGAIFPRTVLTNTNVNDINRVNNVLERRKNGKQWSNL